MLLDLAVARDRLRDLGGRILIPVVLAAVADEDAAKLFNFPDEVAMFHASSSSA